MRLQTRICGDVLSASLNWESADGELRTKKLAVILTMWHRLQLVASLHEVKPLGAFKLPDSFKGTFVYGADPSGIADEGVREEYTKYLAQRNESSRCRVALSAIGRAQEDFIYRVKPAVEELLKNEVSADERAALSKALSVESEEVANLISSLRKAFGL